MNKEREALDREVQRRLEDELWDRKMARAVWKKENRFRPFLAAAAAFLLALGLGLSLWNQRTDSGAELAEQESMPLIFADELAREDGSLDLMASGIVF